MMRVERHCEKCSQTAVAKGLCMRHYNQARVAEAGARPSVPARPKWEYLGNEGELILQCERGARE
jgi:hypothetical protein